MGLRGILLIGFILVGAFVFPLVTFADKGGQPNNPAADKAAEKTKDHSPPLKAKPEVDVPDKGKDKVRKKVKDLPEQASEKAKQAVQLPNQASEKAKQTVKEVEKKKKDKDKEASKNAVRSSVENGHFKNVKTNPPPVKQEEEQQNKSKQPKQIDYEQEDVTHEKPVPNVKDVKTVSTENRKADVKENKSKQEKFPADQEKPNAVKVVQFPTNTSGSNGVPAKDRTGNGHHTSVFLDKWLLKPEKATYLKRMDPVASRTYEYRDQWVVPPPEQPPQATPFFLII